MLDDFIPYRLIVKMESTGDAGGGDCRYIGGEKMRENCAGCY